MKLIRKTDTRAFEVYQAIIKNGGYCRCKTEKTEANRCMRAEFKEKIEDPEFSGDCHCGLYHKEK